MAEDSTPTQPDQDANGSGNAGTTTPPTDTERRFSQADLDRAIDARLARERKAADERTAKERTAAEQEKLRAQAEWEKLATQHEQTVRELTPQIESVTARYQSLADRNNKMIDGAIKDWPAEVRRLIPTTDDVAARLEAFDNARAIVDKFVADAPRPAPGNRPNPRPQAGPDAAQRSEAELLASGKYNAF